MGDYQSNASAPHPNTNHQNQAPPRGFIPGPAAGQFDVFEWHPRYQSCQKYFLDHAQHDASVLAVCALINISLPHQWHPDPIKGSTLSRTSNVNISPQSRFESGSVDPRSYTNASKPCQPNWVSLVPYIRRLVVTGFDRDAVLHGFFGGDWRKGVGPVQECERRNYLFAAKSGGWATVKSQYDMGPQEGVPFLQPPREITMAEIENAETLWSQWLAMEDWMVGPRAPETMENYAQGSQNSGGQ